MKKSGNKKGFTLVEIIVVLLVIGILLAITIPSIMGYVGKARDAKFITYGRQVLLHVETSLIEKSNNDNLSQIENELKDIIQKEYKGDVYEGYKVINVLTYFDDYNSGSFSVTGTSHSFSSDAFKLKKDYKPHIISKIVIEMYGENSYKFVFVFPNGTIEVINGIKSDFFNVDSEYFYPVQTN